MIGTTTNTPLSEIMTTNLISVLPMETMDKVKALFDKNNIHHIPVVGDDGVIKGIIAKETMAMLCHNMSIFNRQKETDFNDRFLTSVYAEEAMTKHVATVPRDSTVGTALGIFKENLFHALPIVDENKKLVGMVTTYDLLLFFEKTCA